MFLSFPVASLNLQHMHNVTKQDCTYETEGGRQKPAGTTFLPVENGCKLQLAEDPSLSWVPKAAACAGLRAGAEQVNFPEE